MIFRVEKAGNFTIMSNYHLKDKRLTLKAKGLMSQILSLPPEWNYTIEGLAKINLEKVDAISTAINELIKAGYIIRSRERNERGHLLGTVYTIHEEPPENIEGVESGMNTEIQPKPEKPILDNPALDEPVLENPTQLKTNISSINKINTDLLNTHSVHSVPKSLYETEAGKEQNGNKAKSIEEYEECRDFIHENIDYDCLIERHPSDKRFINDIVDLIIETICSARETVVISKSTYPLAVVESRFKKLNCENIESIIEKLKVKNKSDITNMKQYLLAMLYNEPIISDANNTALWAKYQNE
jgi:hypothetical protein